MFVKKAEKSAKSLFLILTMCALRTINEKYKKHNERRDCNLCLSVCLSDHNLGTPEPICLKF